MQVCWEQDAYAAKHLPTNSLLITKGEKSAFTVGTPGGHPLNQVIQVDITKNGTNGHHLSPDVMC